jgi:hypothetical protein
MAWTAFYVGSYSTTTNQHLSAYYIKTYLKTIGWTVKTSGYSVSYSAVGDVITNTSVMNTGTAWYVLKSPSVNGSSRELLVARENGTNGAWNLYYSYSGAFSGGSTSALPTATDQKKINTAISGAGFFADGYTGGLVVVGGGAAEGYSWYCLVYDTSTKRSLGFVAYDNLTNTNSSDIDPYVIWINNKKSNLYPDIIQTNIAPQAWLAKGMSSESFGDIYPVAFSGNNTTTVDSLGINPTGYVDFYPLIYGKTTGTKGIKGQSRLFKWSSANIALNGLVFGITIPDDTILFDNFALSWNLTPIS